MYEMSEFTQLLFVGAGMLAAGGIIGFAIGRNSSPQTKTTEELKEQLHQSQEEKEEYQREVADHFAQTAELVDQMNQSYKSVHEHLASSALKLTNPDISRQILEAGSSPVAIESTSMEELQEQPKDWAPKSPGDKGTLREDFGLEKKREEEELSEAEKPAA